MLTIQPAINNNYISLRLKSNYNNFYLKLVNINL